MIDKNLELFKKIIWMLIIFSAFFGGYLGIDRLAAYKILILIYIFICAINILRLKKIRYFKNTPQNTTTKVFLIWVIYASLSLLWCDDKSIAIKNIYYIVIAMILIYGCTSNFKNYKQLSKFNRILKIIIIIIMGVGIWESITGNHLYMSAANYASKPEYRFTPTGFQVNTNDYATLLTIYMPIILISFKNKNKIIDKIINFSLIIIYGYLLFMTNSRANQLACVIGVITYFLLMSARKKIKYIYIISIVALTIFISSSNTFIDVYNSINYEIRNDIGTNSDSVRINLIKNGFLMLKDTYLFGVGAGNIEANMLDYSAYNYVGDINNMHNFWMEVLVDYGIAIFILFVMWYVGLIKKLICIYKNINLKEYKKIVSLIISSMIMFIISSMSSSSIMSGVYIWLYFGYIVTFINIYQEGVIKSENINTITYVSK